MAYSVYLIYLKKRNHRNTKGVLSLRLTAWALPKNVWYYITWWKFGTKFVKICGAYETWCLCVRSKKETTTRRTFATSPLRRQLCVLLAVCAIFWARFVMAFSGISGHRVAYRGGLGWTFFSKPVSSWSWIKRHHVSPAPQILTNLLQIFTT